MNGYFFILSTVEYYGLGYEFLALDSMYSCCSILMPLGFVLWLCFAESVPDHATDGRGMDGSNKDLCPSNLIR